MSVVFSRAPLRVSLGGGGTDLPSYYRDHGGFLVAGSIDKYVYMLIHTEFQQRWRMKYSTTEEVDDVRQIEHPILRETLLRQWRGNPLEIASVADVPAGTGMGSSGAYTVCLIKGLSHARRTSTTPAALAESACEIEIGVLKDPVGKQDQYAAAHGGICTYEFNRDDSVNVTPLELELSTLQRLRNQMLLFYMGGTRAAASILEDQNVRSSASDPVMLENLHQTKELGIRSAEVLRQGDLDGYAELMHEHWETKRRRSPGMTDERIDRLYTLARRSGAIGGKLVGAGGGGFLLVYASKPDDTRQAMAAAGIRELPFDFEFCGAQSGEYA